MSWRTVKLGELYTAHNGLAKGRQFFGSGYPFLSFSTVFNNLFIPDTLPDLVMSSEKERRNFDIKKGDIFITRTSETIDELGMSCVALKDYPEATYNGFTKRLRPIDSSIIHPRFIGYYLRLPSFRAGFMAFSTMTTRASLRNEDLLSMEIMLPDLATQQKIAGILSAYDDLIENNQKQIQLLEEAAQRLYKEWFVDLRFPGHENTRIVDGVPEGWEVCTIDDISSLRKTAIKAPNIPPGIPYIGLEHIPRKDFCLSSWGDSSDVSSTKYQYKENDILFGKIRPYFHKVGFSINNGVTSTDTLVMTAKKDSLWPILLLSVFSKDFVNYSYQNCKEGSKMPRADWNIMKSYKVLNPEKNILKKFNNNIFSITKKIKILAHQNNIISETRNMLLPKLMKKI